MNIVTAIRNLPEPPAKQPRKRWLLGARRGRARRAARSPRGIGARNAITLGFGVSLLVIGLVPVCRAAGRPQPRGAHGGRARLVAWFVLPIGRWLFGTLSVDFSIFILSGIMIVRRRELDAHVQRRSAARRRSRGRWAGSARSRPCCGCRWRIRFATASAPASRWRCSPWSCSRSSTGATTTTSFVNGVNDLGTYGGGFDIRATVAPTRPIPDMRAALRQAPGIDPADFRVVSAQSFMPVKVRQVGVRAGSPRTTPFAGSTRRSSPTRPTASPRAPTATRPTPQVWRAMNAPRRARGRRRSRRAAQVELQLRRGAAVPAEGLLPRGQALRAGVRRRPRPADRPARAAHGHRRALGHRAARDGRHPTSQRTLAALFGARGDPDRVPVRPPPRRRRRPRRPSSSSRRSSPTACRPTRCRSCSPTRSAPRSRSTG